MTKNYKRLDPLSVYVGDCLRTIRKQRGLSLAEVGERLGLTAAAVCYHETGRSQLNLRQFIQTCAVLNTDPADIITAILQEQPQLIREWNHVPTDPHIS